MSNLRVMLLVAFIASSVDQPATAQTETVTYTPSAPRPVNVDLGGELISYQLDGGCGSQPLAVRGNFTPQPLDAGECTRSKLRTRRHTADAIDGGTFAP